MTHQESFSERAHQRSMAVGKSRKLLAVALLGFGIFGTGTKLFIDAVDSGTQADAAYRAGQVEEAYDARSIEAEKLALGGSLAGIGGVVMMAAAGYWGGAGAQRQRLASAANTQPPVASGKLYDGPGTTVHGEPPAPVVEARIEVPLTPPVIEWQPPQSDPNIAFRRPQ
ncbi:MAG: hypothetical protein KIH63_004960 [Candidatus Saccharibacteria bacterium]|nr:hypothetical protein [Candidatus Saccharibacteria bacterium]